MKFLRCMFFAVASAVLNANGLEMPQEQAEEQQQLVKMLRELLEKQYPFADGVDDCAALEAATGADGSTHFPGGTIKFLGPIHCDVPVVWGVESDTVIESQTAIDTMDLVFVVFPGVRLVFRAPAISLKRGKALALWREAILYNEGVMKFEVTAPYPSYVAGGSTVDEHGLLWGSEDSKFSLNKPPHFTQFELVVADSTGATDGNGRKSGTC